MQCWFIIQKINECNSPDQHTENEKSYDPQNTASICYKRNNKVENISERLKLRKGVCE